MKYNRLFVAVAIIVLIVASYILYHAYDWHEFFTIATMRRHAQALDWYVQERYAQTVLSYMMLCVFFSFLPLPGDTLISIAGGYLFGALWGTIYTDICITISASVMFLVVRYLLAHIVRRYENKWLLFIRRQIKLYGQMYFLFIRLIPLIPVSIVNLTAGLTRISFFTFVWTTAVGMLPIAFILSYSGQQLRHIHHIGDIFTPKIVILLCVLAFITLSPLWIKLIRSQMMREESNK